MPVLYGNLAYAFPTAFSHAPMLSSSAHISNPIGLVRCHNAVWLSSASEAQCLTTTSSAKPAWTFLCVTFMTQHVWFLGTLVS